MGITVIKMVRPPEKDKPKSCMYCRKRTFNKENTGGDTYWRCVKCRALYER